jgi:EAL domain-containing protein (putative c-di-GMP-specific phosphodiesterase class I)
VAEGVETLDQVRELASLGCNLGQGYYFSRPVTREVALESLMQVTDGSSLHRLRA